MKVALWTSWITASGIAAYSSSLAGELRRQPGVEVDIVSVPYGDRDPGRMAQTLARLNAADVVHIQHDYPCWGGIGPGASTLPQYYRLLRTPRIVTAHNTRPTAELLGLPLEERLRQRLAKHALAALPSYRARVEREPFMRAAAVIVHTAAARERLLRRGLAPEKVHVIRPGVPALAEGADGSGAAAEPVRGAEAAARAEAVRERFGLAGKRVVTIFGYVVPEKGYEPAIRVLAGMPPAARLLIAGGPDEEWGETYVNALKSWIHERGFSERAAITGYLQEREVAAVMALSDLVLAPYLHGDGGYAVMTALAYGKPVLASDLPLFREIHAEKPCLELFPAGDEGALADRLAFLLASTGARQKLAAAAREYAAEHPWSQTADQTLALYRDIMRQG